MQPLFPFGFGLGYTSFTFSNLAVTTPRASANDIVEAEVTVANTGSRAGQEVVQLYVRDAVASRSRPVRELKAFEKIALAPGESRVVKLRVPGRELGFHLEDGTYVVEPGRFDIWVGASALADLASGFEIIDGLRLSPGQREATRIQLVK
jgi:beta-glucosidase